jgi:hypothetical protein
MLTFRSTKIVYYGPHRCQNCGAMICKAGMEFGGTAFNYPQGPIYPNTEWHPHICDPKDVGRSAKQDDRGERPEETREPVSHGYIAIDRSL